MFLKCIYQQTRNECGIACLSMVLASLGINNSFSEVKLATDYNDVGTSFAGLINGAEHFGVNAIALEGGFSDFIRGYKENEVKLPCIAHVRAQSGYYHYIVIYRICGSYVFIADPEKGKKVISFNKIERIWLGHILCFESKPCSKDNRNKKISGSYFRKIILSNKRLLIILSFLCILVSLLEIIGTFGISLMIEHESVGHFHSETVETIEENSAENLEEEEIDKDSYVYKLKLDIIADFIENNEDRILDLNNLFVGLLCVFIGVYIFEVFRGLVLSTVNKRVNKVTISKFFSDLSEIKQSFYRCMDSGAIIGRFSDIERIKNALANSLVIIFLDTTAMIFSAVVLVIISPKMFLFSIPIIAAYTLVLAVFNNKIKKHNNEAMEQNAKTISFLNEYIDGVDSIRNTHFEKYIDEKTQVNVNAFVNSKYRVDIITLLQVALTGLCSLAGTLVILRIGIEEVRAGLLLQENFLAYYMLISYFISPIRHLVELQAIIQSANIAWQRLHDVFAFPKERTGKEKTDDLSAFSDLSVMHLNVEYGMNKRIIEDFNLNIHLGEKILIKGKNGSGKTSLSKAISGLIDIEDNMVFINGKDINTINKRSVRSVVQYLPASPFFFNDTIFNNLTIGNTNITEHDIDELCALLGANEYISNFSSGYSTMLYNNAANVSEGQRQMLAIIRALLQNPSVLILDEATCSIDEKQESVLYSQINSEFPHIAIIFISHRKVDSLFFNQVVSIGET